MSEKQTEPMKIDRSTLVPIGVVVSIVLTLCGVLGFLDSRFTAIDKALDKQDRRLEKLEESGQAQWTSIQMKLWVSEFRRLNPDVKVPE